MTLTEAIEILTIHNDHNPDYTDRDREDAHRLGIEALKYVKAQYDPDHQMMRIPLPGETED